MISLNNWVEKLAQALLAQGYQLAVAESCTGGWIAQELTALPGSSRWFERGFVTYSNAAKCEMLGVPHSLIQAHGAVSEPVVKAMAQGAVQHSRAQVSMAVTGIAGPGHDDSAKPVGTVWLGWVTPKQGVVTEHYLFSGDRRAVREQAVQHAIKHLFHLLTQ